MRLLPVLLLILVACRPDVNDEVFPIVHYNINIVADQTNRVEMKAQNSYLLHDTTIINAIIGSYYPKVFNHRRDLGQKDIIRYGRVSAYNALPDTMLTEINLKRFANQRERISYVLPGGKFFERGGLYTDIEELKKSVEYSYITRDKDKYSGDLYTFFSSSLTELNVFKDTIKTSQNGLKYEEYHRNIMVVITDGYLEYGNYDRNLNCKGNICEYLNQSLIDEIRRIANKENLTVDGVLSKYNYGIKPVKNELLSYTDVIFMEFYDRSRRPSGSATLNPTDVEITKAIWKKWMKESGAKSVRIYEVLNSKDAIRSIIERDFLQ